MTEIKVKNTLSQGLKKYFSKVAMEGNSGADFKARAQVAIQMMTFMNQGSPATSVVPPIKMGILRGSGSVFVGSTLIRTTASEYKGGTPNQSYSNKKNDITIGYNTAYAAKLHESEWQPGPLSEKSGDVGNKWVEKHLASDGKILMQMYGAVLKRESGA